MDPDQVNTDQVDTDAIRIARARERALVKKQLEKRLAP